MLLYASCPEKGIVDDSWTAGSVHLTGDYIIAHVKKNLLSAYMENTLNGGKKYTKI
jgi:hypothetical protein